MELNKQAIVIGQGELAKTTHLAVGAHQDDIEFMAFAAISECYRAQDKSFCAVVTADGAGSPRNGKYAAYSDEDMKAVRIAEQKRAAQIGDYGAQILLCHSSSQVRELSDNEIVDEYVQIFRAARPRFVYTHNLVDKHPTHVATALKVIEALRRLNSDVEAVYGCEVWRDLDWLNDDDKVVLDCSANADVARSLTRVFDSQIEGGKRYDLAVEGRRRAHATFSESHACDGRTMQNYAMDLTPLVADKTLSPRDYVEQCIDRFKSSALALIDKLHKD